MNTKLQDIALAGMCAGVVLLGFLSATALLSDDPVVVQEPPRISQPDLRPTPTTPTTFPPPTTPPVSTSNTTPPTTAFPSKLWQWNQILLDDGRYEIEIEIDYSIYPADGVVFYVNGLRDRTDLRGPREGDHFHASAYDAEDGDIIVATWISDNGINYNAAHTVRF